MTSTKNIFLGLPVFLAFAVCWVLLSCVGGFGADNAGVVLVEKSRLVPPRWSREAPNQITDNGNYLEYYVVKNDQTNLTLGVRQSREFAIAAMEIALVASIATKLHENHAVAEFENKKSSAQRLDSVILKELDDQKNSLFEVTDIYYEKWKNLQPSSQSLNNDVFFRVFILVRTNKEKVADIIRGLTNKLRSTKEQLPLD